MQPLAKLCPNSGYRPETKSGKRHETNGKKGEDERAKAINAEAQDRSTRRQPPIRIHQDAEFYILNKGKQAQGPMYMYCLFCQTQKCEQVAKTIEQLLGIRVINPKIIQRYWKRGEESLRVHNYMPGYIFLYSDEPIKSFKDVNRISGVIRRLGTSDTGYDLTGVDRSFAKMLLDMNGTIGIMKTYKEGDRVKLIDSLYSGFSGEIKRLDRKKGRAQIEFEFDGSTQTVWVGYELIDDKDIPRNVSQTNTEETAQGAKA